MSLADAGWIWEGQEFDPGVRISIYGLGQGAAYMGLTRANFMFLPNDEYALQLMSNLDEVTCDISKWDFEWGEGNALVPGSVLQFSRSHGYGVSGHNVSHRLHRRAGLEIV